MFDKAVDELAVVAARLTAAPTVEADAVERAELIKSVREVQDSLDGLQARLLQEFDEHADYAEHGSATTAAWARRELRMTGTEARTQVRNGRTLRDLPKVAHAAHSGKIREAHVRCFTAGTKKVGLDVMTSAQDWLLDVALACDPAELRQTIDALADVAYPDDLDEAWQRGMDRHDINLAKVGDGYHLTGFLDILTGAQFKVWLEARSAPREADDERTASQRRVDALSLLLNSALEHGLPTDKGIRPQLNVDCDLDRLLAMMRSADPAGTTTGSSPAEPANLAGFGPIGEQLLSYLTCASDLTAILTTGDAPQSRVLNVGRSWRLATMKQRQAVKARQDHLCANPGCRHTHLEVHHVTWWRRGGRTDLANLVGLCRRCHTLVHQNKLTIKADDAGGFTFTRARGPGSGTPIRDQRRTTARNVRRRIRRLLQSTAPVEPPSTRSTGDQKRSSRGQSSLTARCQRCGFRPQDAPAPPRPVAPMRT